VRDVLATLSRLQRDRRTYPPTYPILVRRRESLAAQFSALLERLPEITLEVGPEALTFEGTEVYRNDEQREGIAFHLFRHGIREIRFLRGLSAEALQSFIEVLNAAIGEELFDDDLITLLWERDLGHIRYAAVDDVPTQAPWVTDPVGTLTGLLRRKREPPGDNPYATIQRMEVARSQTDSRVEAYLAVRPEDLDALRAALDEDGRRDVALDAVDVLAEVLRGGVSPDDTRDLLRILQRVIEVAVEERNFARAAAVLHQLIELATSAPALLPVIQPIVLELSAPPFLRRLVELVKDGVGADDKGLYLFLTKLTAPAAVPLTEGFLVVQDRKTRKVLCDAIAEIVKGDVSVLAALARDDRWFLPRNVAYILGQAGNPEGLRILKVLSEHPHEKVRAEALRAATRFPSPQLPRDLALRALQDASRAVRVLALELAPSMGEAAAGHLVAAVMDKGFPRLDPDLQRSTAVALGRTAGEAAIPVLAPLLSRRGHLWQKRPEETRTAAVAGIAAVGTPAAVRALRDAAAADPDLRLVVEQALRESRGG
jgi:hypothetical protein